MNLDRVQGICLQLGGSMKEHWGNLTGDALVSAAGLRDRRAGRIREQLGIARQQADQQLEEFKSRNRNWRDLSSR